ncbi:MAG: aminoacetone oxidase family FAD-binding enzyme, partial [Clostridia bacterium]
SALNAFSPDNTIAYFENIGLRLKTERGGRIFPVSDKSSDVTAALCRRLNQLGVEVKLQEKVLNIKYDNERISKVITDKNTYEPDSVILATGGLSYPLTGSTGDGYRFAKQSGHTLITPRPALCPINLDGVFDVSGNTISLEKLPLPTGLSLLNVTASVKEKGKAKPIASEFGELLFTHTGLSGPTILTISSLINRKNIIDLQLSIDLKPALSHEMLDKRILRDFSSLSNKQFKNALDALLPKSLIPYIIKLSNIEPNAYVHSITKEQRAGLVNLFKSLNFSILSLGTQDAAIVTAGGIAVNEIQPSTMRSKLIENLYFAGEIIDVDGFTGGYNIQIALSTGRLAGKSV